jgi:hypothetical protein
MENIIYSIIFFSFCLIIYLRFNTTLEKNNSDKLFNLVEKLNSGKYSINKHQTVFIHKSTSYISLTYKNSFSKSSYEFLFEKNRTINNLPQPLTKVTLTDKDRRRTTYYTHVTPSSGTVSNNDYINKNKTNIVDTINATFVFIKKIKFIIKKNIHAT